jgi:hypothetical protein
MEWQLLILLYAIYERAKVGLAYYFLFFRYRELIISFDYVLMDRIDL